MKNPRKRGVQLVAACVATGFGIALIITAFFVPPMGVIDPTVLTAYGETLTFAGALLGIDYHYRDKPNEKNNSTTENTERYANTEKDSSDS